MAAAPIDVVGSSPITFTGSQGEQRFVPLSALQFSGSTVQIKSAWASAFDTNETKTLITLATAQAAAGELDTATGAAALAGHPCHGRGAPGRSRTTSPSP